MTSNIWVVSLWINSAWAQYGHMMFKWLRDFHVESVNLIIPIFSTELTKVKNLNNELLLSGVFWRKSPFFVLINPLNYINFYQFVKKRNIKTIFFASNSMISLLLLVICRKMWLNIYSVLHDPIPHSGEWDWLKNSIMNWSKRNFVHLSDKIIVHWEKLKMQTSTIFNIDKSRIISIFIPDFWDLVPDYKNIKTPTNKILFFGRIVRYKWLDLALQAMKILKQRWVDVVLVIAWSWDIQPYQEDIQTLGTSIELYNQYIPDAEIWKYFRDTLCCILPYHDATASGVVPLAYACHRAVIVTDVGELTSVVKDSVTGRIVPPWDIHGLADKIEIALKNTDQTYDFWDNWKEFAEEYLTRESQIERIYLW